MNNRIPLSIQPVLSAYLQRIDRELPGFLAAYYLHGSLALDAFNPRFSDIDFIAVATAAATRTDCERLQALHHSLAAEFPNWQLEGSYLQWHDLGRPQHAIAPSPCIHDHAFHAKAHFDINSVTWWVLQHHGIALRGPEPRTLHYNTDWDDLVTQMRANLNSYWVSFTRSPRRIAVLLTDNGVQWAVLGVLRQFYTFREHQITSKSGAGRYALAHVPSRWHRIIQEALQLRDGSQLSLYRSRVARAAETIRFLGYIIADTNEFLKGNKHDSPA